MATDDFDEATPTAGKVELGALDREIGYVLRRAQLAVFANFIEAFAAVDIKPAQYSALTVIEANPGIAQGRVAEALGIQKTNFVAMIGALEKRGLIERRPSPADRRAHCLHLTAPGATLTADLHAAAAAMEARIVALVGEESYRGLFAPLTAIASGRF